MPKLKNVSAAELDNLRDQVENIMQDARDYNARIEAGYTDDIAEPIGLARFTLAASRALADLASTLLTKAAIQEQDRELEALRIEAAKKK